ncbi:MAG: hypothetical protein ACHQPI_05510 [Thermoanaerobaculia bacterium]
MGSTTKMTSLDRLRWILVVCALAAGPAAGQTVFVDGRVSASGPAPLAGITVAAYTLKGIVAATTGSDSTGYYRLALNAGSYRLLAYDLNGVWATSFYSNATSFDTAAQIDLTANLAGIDFSMVRGFPVSGLVSSSQGGPLLGMVVAAYNADGTRRGFEKTNGVGAYSILLPPGTYRFASYDDNLSYATSFYLAQTSYDAATPVNVSAAVSGIDFTLAPAARVSGSTSDRQSRLPAPSITVSAYNPAGDLVTSMLSDANGLFSMALAPGDFRFVAFDPAGHFAVSFYEDAASFASAPSFHLTAGQVLGGVDFFLGPVTPVATPTALFVPAAANLQGAAATYFQTDLWITNPSDAAISVTVTYLPSGQDNSGRAGTPVEVGAHMQVAFTNVLQALFAATGAGALKLDGNGPFLATSRTYNSASPPGTYGVGVSGRPLSASVSRGLIPGLSNNAAFRSNVAVMNPQPIPVLVTLTLYRADGTLLGQGTRTLAPLDWFQASTIFAFLGVGGSAANAYVTVSSPNGSIFSYGSVVDQVTGDSTVIEAVGY